MQPDEQGKLTEQAEDEQPVSGTTPPPSDRPDKPAAGAPISVPGGVRALLERRGLPSTVSGVALVGLAVVLGTGSALSVPLLIIGVVMLIVGLVGPRLQGRFAIEFGPNGASIEIRTHIAPSGSSRPAAPPATWNPHRALIALGGEDARRAHDSTEAAMLLAETIEAQREILELDVKQLKELLAGPDPPA